RDLTGIRIVDGPGDAIGLARIAGIVVAVDDVTDALPQLLCPLGVERHPQEEPELKIAGRGLHDHAWADRRRWRPPHALVGIAIDHKGKHRDRNLELAALAAAQARRK